MYVHSKDEHLQACAGCLLGSQEGNIAESLRMDKWSSCGKGRLGFLLFVSMVQDILDYNHEYIVFLKKKSLMQTVEKNFFLEAGSEK